jgi:hypothetical protein
VIPTTRAQVRPDNNPKPGEGHDQADQQVDPAPGGGVELEQVVARPNPARFKFAVLKLYGPICAVCDLPVTDLL